MSCPHTDVVVSDSGTSALCSGVTPQYQMQASGQLLHKPCNLESCATVLGSGDHFGIQRAM
jgi:hypothetical protein